MKTKTKYYRVKEAIQALEVGESLNKTEFIVSVWDDNDFFISRSFDVMFNKAKKELQGREFKTINSFIVRKK